MKFTKNIMGIVSTLILVILLTQSRFFDFLTETALGRMVLLAFIILISYTNQILGLLAVLAIIIAFNQYTQNVVQGYNYYEGFNVSDLSGNVTASTVVNDKSTMLKDKEKLMKKKLNDVNKKINSTAETATTTASTTSTTESFGGREGFCMTDRELNMLRGKQSNSIPVFNSSREQNDDISPSDKSVFSNLFSTF
jgi:hypothetical protein